MASPMPTEGLRRRPEGDAGETGVHTGLLLPCWFCQHPAGRTAHDLGSDFTEVAQRPAFLRPTLGGRSSQKGSIGNQAGRLNGSNLAAFA